MADVHKTALSDYEHKHNLHWSQVSAWQSIATPALRGAEDLVVATKMDLKDAKWAGMIPKVACIAVVPRGRDAQYQMEYFVHGFKAQNYEGPKQLVLVYHYKDAKSKRIAQKYSDGLFIKAVAARGEELSATAYRFGAWAADADVIARYDFGAWHHPSRLALQVRSLALTGRPASRLQGWTARDYAEGGFAQTPPEAQVNELGEASLIGEKTWMEMNWYPALQGESDTLTKTHRRHVVELEMPELLVYGIEP